MHIKAQSAYFAVDNNRRGGRFPAVLTPGLQRENESERDRGREKWPRAA